MSAPRLPHITVYTDGGCRPNPGPGGWAAILLRPDQEPQELSGHVEQATNNRMELTAPLEALRALDQPHRVELVTDSEYVRRGITEWLERWRANGWKTASRSPVMNRDLWQALAAELERHQVSWRWVKGHAGDRLNERADALASAAIGRPELPLEDSNAVHLFVAIAYSGKLGAGAWATLLRWRGTEREAARRVESCSANQLHILSAIEGLRLLKRSSRVHLYTTSSYLRDGASTWTATWRQRGWRTQTGTPVRHRRLWEQLESLVARHTVAWHVIPEAEAPEELQRSKARAKEVLRRD